VSLRDGGVIRKGLSAELDELRSIRGDGKSYISALETKEREATGIGSLKVRFNKVFGYFIEVSKSNLHLVPEHYHRKQTVASGERFVTPELKEHEGKVLHAQERIESLELELFRQLRIEVAREASRLKAVARATATIDLLAALAELAAREDYCRPAVDDAGRIRIVGGRHPVVERFLIDERFVPNDTEVESGGEAIAVLTGPNMGGKSTYLRQVALIVLLAQIGAFVPAGEATIGVVDRIFCRVGASDSLAEGQSTFMVEMSETANILHHATSRSLLLLDEIGRGTSTFDGLSIAWAVIEFLHELPGGAPRTLFATHYHELTELAVELDSVVNLRMSVREWKDEVVFLHLVQPGASDRSYGIQVARLAGVPREVVRRAGEILSNIERDEYGRDGRPRRARHRDASRRPVSRQPSLFATEPEPSDPLDRNEAEILGEIAEQDTDRLTPIEALSLLAAWQRRLKGEDPAPGGAGEES
jgi:DNA mismatch repair protein MutS